MFQRGVTQFATNKINYGIKRTRFLSEHRLSPILMRKIGERVRPIKRKTNAPKANGKKQHNSHRRKRFSDCESCEYHYRLNAPIRIVNRGVGKQNAEDKGNHGCRSVRYNQLYPPSKIQSVVSENCHKCRKNVNNCYQNIAYNSIFLCFFIFTPDELCILF